MILQDSKVTCGPCALANALDAMGHQRAVPELVQLCKTDAINGTSTRNLLKALAHLKESCDLDEPIVLRTASDESAWGVVFSALVSGRAAILVVDDGQHYVALCGTLGQRVLLADSADSAVVSSLTREELMDRWDSGGRFPYWGVVL